MSDVAELREWGRAALPAGEATRDVPMSDGHPRWGVAAVLRPAGEAVQRLTELAATVHAPGHWGARRPRPARHAEVAGAGTGA